MDTSSKILFQTRLNGSSEKNKTKNPSDRDLFVHRLGNKFPNGLNKTVFHFVFGDPNTYE
uniref:Uncharacterized protein n=1 Tax=Leptospira ellisii TaxID=2023197 RepID=A0A2N0BB19_9LEPT|nr:hypothetical protein CH379_06185 [Leptospira ellisii]